MKPLYRGFLTNRFNKNNFCAISVSIKLLLILAIQFLNTEILNETTSPPFTIT